MNRALDTHLPNSCKTSVSRQSRLRLRGGGLAPRSFRCYHWTSCSWSSTNWCRQVTWLGFCQVDQAEAFNSAMITAQQATLGAELLLDIRISNTHVLIDPWDSAWPSKQLIHLVPVSCCTALLQPSCLCKLSFTSHDSHLNLKS